MTENITYAIQVNKDGEWVWSLYYDKPFVSKEQAKTALKKAEKSMVFSYRIVKIIPLED